MRTKAYQLHTSRLAFRSQGAFGPGDASFPASVTTTGLVSVVSDITLFYPNPLAGNVSYASLSIGVIGLSVSRCLCLAVRVRQVCTIRAVCDVRGRRIFQIFHGCGLTEKAACVGVCLSPSSHCNALTTHSRAFRLVFSLEISKAVALSLCRGAHTLWHTGDQKHVFYVGAHESMASLDDDG